MSLIKAIENCRSFINYNYEKWIVSKIFANILLGHEIDGREYQAPTEADKINDIVALENGTKFETSLTLDYRKESWGIERIVLDTVSNHLPEDSNGNEIDVEYLQNGEWVDFREEKSNAMVEAVRIKDNGSGYDFRLLDVLYSTKGNNTQSVGQFGEGLKMVAAAALREGLAVEYASRNWSAKPYAKDENIDSNDFKRLCFSVKKEESQIQGSQTIINKPSSAVLDEISQLGDAVILFNEEHKVLYEALKDSDEYVPKIIDLNNGKAALFVKGIRIRNGIGSYVNFLDARKSMGKKGFTSIFSYDLGISQISPDRELADYNTVRTEISKLLNSCEDENIITKILLTANANKDTKYEEYESLLHEGHHHYSSNGGMAMFHLDASKECYDIWRKVFKKTFGEMTVLKSRDLEANKDADKLFNYKTIDMHESMVSFLHNIGIPTAQTLLYKEREFDWVDNFNVQENELLDMVPLINQIVLGCSDNTPIKVFEKEYMVVKGPEGEHIRKLDEIDSCAGFYCHDKKFIAIKKNNFENKIDFLNVYIHELGHKITGKGDYDREFTDFFCSATARLTYYFMSQGNNPSQITSQIGEYSPSEKVLHISDSELPFSE